MNKYTEMQKRYYEEEAAKWSPQNRDPVVGSFDAHNAWEDYEILFDGIDTADMVALDFGCGPGRCVVKYTPRFRRIDGADISQKNIDHAMLATCKSGVHYFYTTDGGSLYGIQGEEYDLVYSVICLQHICVHDIRFSIMKDIYRVLKPGGVFTFQMGFGGKDGYPWVTWYENKYDADGTNGMCDVSITDPLEVSDDLHRIGFKTVRFSDLRPTGPGDSHKNWVFIKAWK